MIGVMAYYDNVQGILNNFQSQIHNRPNTNDYVLTQVLAGLLGRYFDRVPDAMRVFEICEGRGDIVKNDHIAFRTLDMRSLLKLFLYYGYEVRFDDEKTKMPFNFKAKKLTAVWLKHPNFDMPRVFISEIRLKELGRETQDIVAPYLAQLEDPIDSLNLDDASAVIDYLHSGLWPTPTHSDYQKTGEESEYLAWVLYNEYYLNHFTLTVNALDSFGFKKTLEDVIQKDQSDDDYLSELREVYVSFMKNFNKFLRDQGFGLNAPSGNELNISADGLLLQSSTQANMVTGKFPDGDFEVPGSYVEFAYRGHNGKNRFKTTPS